MNGIQTEVVQSNTGVDTVSIAKERMNDLMIDNKKKGGFVLRLAAYITDSLILGITIGLFLNLVFSNNEDIAEILGILFLLVYFTLATCIYGTTIGKKLFNLRVEYLQGGKPELARAFVRDFVGRIISAPPFFLGYFWVIWDKDKQAWHDKLAKTYVIQVAPLERLKGYLRTF